MDLKIENDMREVIAEMKGFRSELTTKLESAIGATNSSIGALKSETSLIKWLIGGIATLILWSIFKK